MTAEERLLEFGSLISWLPIWALEDSRRLKPAATEERVKQLIL
jgi:hypothetical protein